MARSVCAGCGRPPTCEVSILLALELMTHCTQLLQIVGVVVVSVAVAMIHFCDTSGPGGYAVKLSGTVKPQTTVLIDTASLLVGSDPDPVCMTSV